MSPVSRLHAGSTALVLFDFLKGHIRTGDPATETRYAPVVANAVRLMTLARSVDMMIAYTNGAHRPDNATSGVTLRDTDNRLRPLGDSEARRFVPAVHASTSQAEVIDELAPRASDYIVPKYRWSAFYQTYLDLALRARGVRTIVLAGGSTDVGIASTAFAARDMDYSIVIVSDACTSPETDNHEQLMRRVFPRMSRVRTTLEVESLLGA
ncbi:MAG: cysteine hydrolase [Pseudomonadota bacterium]|nr:cysteine hydrolase [Pseudomonadota bacterium]